MLRLRALCRNALTKEYGGPWLVTLTSCPKCGDALVSSQEAYGQTKDGYRWSEPSRVWPSPPAFISLDIPDEIRETLLEADKCLSCKAYTASVGMSGRALEAVGRHFCPDQAQSLMLAAGLKRLNEEKIIDSFFTTGERL
jgi:hypothetical protein